MKGPDFKRYSLRLNSGISRGRFRFQENLQLTHIDATLLNGNPFVDVLLMLPSIPVYDPTNLKGGFGVGSTRLNTFATNPVGAQQLLHRLQSDNRLAGNVSADFSIFDFLTYRLNLGVNAHTYANSADFGAASLGWRLSEEDFFKNALPQINNFKLRASYGVIGNEALFDNYLPYAVVGQNINYVIGTGQQIVSGSSQIRLNSLDIQWEERHQGYRV